ncbi:hypothetical protein C3942_12260 [Solimonas fluminis]|uniref:DUF2937 domain-containing protein n=1 Tax=Solimonas fluminis TaxID=2086571 RepID=A0A2S5TF07_9GAMM|nr:DUF2937 family protein [Solimonas fluminis]PPE73570.1 hypothetical protein C3942_12260 [Solimonas fluminis]
MNLLARFLGGVSERIAAVVLAVAAAQFPVYFLAYGNTLAGAQMEAEARYRELLAEAATLHLGVEDFVRRHEENADAVFQASGRIHRSTLERYRRYSAMQEALRSAPAWERPLVLARNFDPAIHAAARFEPGLPLTLEAGAYALAGLLLAWLLTSLVGLAFRGGGARRADSFR